MNATTYTPPADIDARRSRALVIGVTALVLCAVGFVINRDQFFRAWLIGYMLWLGVALGNGAVEVVARRVGQPVHIGHPTRVAPDASRPLRAADPAPLRPRASSAPGARP